METSMVYERCLEWYDGPLLFLAYGDDRSKQHLCLWADIDPELWLCFSITSQNLAKYEKERLTLRAIFGMAEEYHLVRDVRFDGSPFGVELIDNKEVKEEWWPGG